MRGKEVVERVVRFPGISGIYGTASSLGALGLGKSREGRK